MDAGPVAALVVFLGVAVLADWYYCVYLGNTPGRLSWIWPGLVTAGLAVYAALDPGRARLLAVGLAAVSTAVHYHLPRRHASKDDERSERGAGAADRM